MTEPFLFRTPPIPPDFPLFDVHVHLGPSDSEALYYPHLQGEEYLQLMAAAGIEQAFAFAPMRADGYRAANARLCDWSATTGGRVRAFARLGGRELPVTQPQLWMVRRKVSALMKARSPDLDDLERLADYAGVKMLPHMDGLVSAAVYARIAELGLPVLVHGGTHSPPQFIERRILPHVKTPLIIAHCGAFPCDAPLLEDAVDLARRNDNVYLDTSGAWVSEFLRFATKKVPHKLLFGSDAPLAHPLVAWHHLATTVADDRTLEQIGWATAVALFGRGGA